METQSINWKCDDCGTRGAVELPLLVSAWDAMHRADIAHSEAAPGCESYNVLPDTAADGVAGSLKRENYVITLPILF